MRFFEHFIKLFYIIEINDDIRKELNLQEIPYYAVSEFWPDSFAIATNEFKNERLVNPDLGLSMYDFIITGLSSVFQSDALVNTVGISDPSYSAVLKFEKVIVLGRIYTPKIIKLITRNMVNLYRTS